MHPAMPGEETIEVDGSVMEGVGCLFLFLSIMLRWFVLVALLAVSFHA